MQFEEQTETTELDVLTEVSDANPVAQHDGDESQMDEEVEESEEEAEDEMEEEESEEVSEEESEED